MSTLKIYDRQGAEQGEFDVADELLELRRGAQALHEVVVAQRAAARAGTASTLSKGEVAGSNKKPWRQKGLGRARAGYRQSPIWRGGAVAFGPHPRSRRKKVNRKVARLAFRRALSERIHEGAVRLVRGLGDGELRTRDVDVMLKALDMSAPLLLVVAGVDRALALAARNLDGVAVVAANEVNTTQVVRYPALLVVEDAMPVLVERLAARKEKAA